MIILYTFIIKYITINAESANEAQKMSLDGYGVKVRLIYDIFGNIAGLFIYIAVPLGVIAVVLGGIYYIMGGYKTEFANKGKEMIKKAMIGVILTLAGYGIIIFIGKVLQFIFV